MDTNFERLPEPNDVDGTLPWGEAEEWAAENGRADRIARGIFEDPRGVKEALKDWADNYTDEETHQRELLRQVAAMERNRTNPNDFDSKDAFRQHAETVAEEALKEYLTENGRERHPAPLHAIHEVTTVLSNMLFDYAVGLGVESPYGHQEEQPDENDLSDILPTLSQTD